MKIKDITLTNIKAMLDKKSFWVSRDVYNRIREILIDPSDELIMREMTLWGIPVFLNKSMEGVQIELKLGRLTRKNRKRII